MLNAAGLDEVWVNNERIEHLPRELGPLDALQLADGDTFVALRPLAPSNLGRVAPIVVQERGGELVLSIYNYYQGEPSGSGSTRPAGRSTKATFAPAS